jgi:hypothetical protein
MKYIISEGRLDDIFDKFVDSQYGLVYNKRIKEFNLPNGKPFANIFDKHFYYENDADKYLLRSMFGNNADKLMLDYIRKRFPNVKITAVGERYMGDNPNSLI